LRRSAIKEKGTPFISRGDRSGTHIAELNLWQAADIDVEMYRHPWYKSIGQGMGSILRRHPTPTCCRSHPMSAPSRAPTDRAAVRQD
jgi:hypothetical protein